LVENIELNGLIFNVPHFRRVDAGLPWWQV